MAKPLLALIFLTIFDNLLISTYSQNPQSQTLSQIQQLISNSYPQTATDAICNIDPNPSLTLLCYQNNLTQIHINGDGGSQRNGNNNFSTNLFFSTLSSLNTLKVLSLVNLGLFGPLPSEVGSITTLEILNLSSNGFVGEIPNSIFRLKNLQTLILDNNNFTGRVPFWLSSLQELAVLSFNNNSLSGSLPFSITMLHNLRIVSLSRNNLSGEVSDFRGLTNLQVLDLGSNRFGPHFPKLHNKLVTLVLRENKFRFNVARNLGLFYRLQKLDISENRFVGPFVLPVLSLPLLSYIDISQNKFTGMLYENTTCGSELKFVDLSSNRFTGKLPTCLKPKNSKRVVKYYDNCLSEKEGSDQHQHRYSFCHTEALAVNVIRRKRDKRSDNGRKSVLGSSLAGGIFGGFVICGLVFFVVKKMHAKQQDKVPQTQLIMEKVRPANTIKMLSDARYISETMKLGALGLPPYRTFSLEELKEATNNFSELNLIGEGSHGKVYKGSLTDGTLVGIRSLTMRKRSRVQSYTHQIELVSKLRHRHLVSSIGHCFECCPDESSVIPIFLIFEFVPNKTLRDCISGGVIGHKFTWKQRIAAAIGVANGIQFLHTGIVPGLYSNNLKITDVLLDHDLNAKINNYNLPLLADDMRQIGIGTSPDNVKAGNGVKYADKGDIYDMGVILLEIIVGRAMMSQSAITIAKDLLQVSLKTDDLARRSMVDPAIHKECVDESVKTMMAICLRCLSTEPTERPSVEDVLWNLQFAAQVQLDSSTSNQGSPITLSDSK